MTTTYTEDKDKLISDLKNFIHETEELLHLTADQVGERAESIRFKVTERLKKPALNLISFNLLQSKMQSWLDTPPMNLFTSTLGSP